MAKACKIWREIEKVGNEDRKFSLSVGARITPSCLLKDNSITNGAICFARDFDNNIYVGQYYQKILRVNDKLSITGTLPILVEDPTDSNQGISYVRNFAFNENYVAIVSQIRHIVRIYDRTNYSLVSQIGIYNESGNVVDGRLNDPRDCCWLSSGNLLVASNNGIGINGINDGHVTEYDINGNLIESRLVNRDDGFSSIGTSIIDNPRCMKLDPVTNHLWIGEASGKVVKVSLDTWLIEDVVFPLCDIDISSLESFCFTSFNNLAIASLDFGGVVIINPETKMVVDTIDIRQFGASRDIRDVIELSPDMFAISSWSNRNFSRGIYIVSTKKYIPVTYSDLKIPEGYEIANEHLPKFYNPLSNTFDYPIDSLDKTVDRAAIPLGYKCD